MDERPPSPDDLAAPALRRALTAERARRAALEGEQARLGGAVARQNAALTALREEGSRRASRLQELDARLTAVLEQNAALRAEAAALREENARLRQATGEEQGGAAARQPPPWAKAKAAKREPKPRKQRAKEHNQSRRRAAATAVTRCVRHAVARCPECGLALSGGWVHRRVQVVDLPPPRRVEVTEHELIARRCPGCRRRLLPAPPGAAVGRIGRCRFGPRLAAAVAVMRTVERLPQAQIRARLAREFGLELSDGGLVRLLHLAATQATPAYRALEAAIKASPVVHADETTWREDGQPGYVWSYATPTSRYFQRDPSRGGAVPDGVLGADFRGTLVTDFYAAYDHFPGPHQRCWAHFWRDLDALARQYPDDHDLAAWIDGIGVLWRQATGPRPAAEAGDAPSARRARAARARRYQEALLALCPDTLAPERPEATLAARVRRYQDEFFTFVRDPAVPPTNNLAERSIRPLVIARKISGGTRSPSGSADRMILASVLGTAQLRGDDPARAIEQLFFPAAPAP